MKTFVNFIQAWGIMFMFSLFATSIYIYYFIGLTEMEIALVPQNALITLILTLLMDFVFNRSRISSIFVRSFLFLVIVLVAFTSAAVLFGWFDTGNWKLLGLLFALVSFIYIILWSIYHLIYTFEAKHLNEELTNYKRKKRDPSENH
ncbi:Protein of unknown function [Terribacillus aidingensis]|uniref:DUF3021 domain-containing protein n=1 Tax=Terribacillus aidingensis TaxID=586416 RepID=A0A285P6V0_9BACI|nr:DUF3021 family protein [Terribacillus aidingensis]SNZ17452.1 Protein of unknown function [Terribacillus aidingensis]